MDQLKEHVSGVLDKRGVLSRLKAELRANVLGVLHEQDIAAGGGGLGGRSDPARRQQLADDVPAGPLLMALVHELLEWSRLRCTLQVFEQEAAALLDDSLSLTPDLRLKLGLAASAEAGGPVLLQLLKARLAAPDRAAVTHASLLPPRPAAADSDTPAWQLGVMPPPLAAAAPRANNRLSGSRSASVVADADVPEEDAPSAQDDDADSGSEAWEDSPKAAVWVGGQPAHAAAAAAGPRCDDALMAAYDLSQDFGRGRSSAEDSYNLAASATADASAAAAAGAEAAAVAAALTDSASERSTASSGGRSADITSTAASRPAAFLAAPLPPLRPAGKLAPLPPAVKPLTLAGLTLGRARRSSAADDDEGGGAAPLLRRPRPGGGQGSLSGPVAAAPGGAAWASNNNNNDSSIRGSWQDKEEDGSGTDSDDDESVAAAAAAAQQQLLAAARRRLSQRSNGSRRSSDNDAPAGPAGQQQQQQQHANETVASHAMLVRATVEARMTLSSAGSSRSASSSNSSGGGLGGAAADHDISLPGLGPEDDDDGSVGRRSSDVFGEESEVSPDRVWVE